MRNALIHYRQDLGYSKDETPHRGTEMSVDFS